MSEGGNIRMSSELQLTVPHLEEAGNVWRKADLRGH